MKYLFGPVNSRRLGRSLGVDLLPFKTCTLDCIYCECGWTTAQTARRREFVPTRGVIAELDAYLSANPTLDYVTFSGSGEPTLHRGIGRVIAHLKSRYPQYKVAVLTNGTLLGDLQVQAELHAVDLVVPSLDAATEGAFERICQPVAELGVASVIAGIAAFRRSFAGLLLLEIFIVPGQNDSPEELAALKEAATFIAPDAIQLNSLDRPAPEPGIGVPSVEELERVRDFLAPLQVQAVRRRGRDEAVPWDDPRVFEEVLAVLENRATNLAGLSVAIGMREGDVAKTLAQMAGRELVRVRDDVIEISDSARRG